MTAFISSIPAPKTKKELKAKVAEGKLYEVTEPFIFGQRMVKDADNIPIVGPCPRTRKWFAQVSVKDGFITRVIA